MVKANKYRRTIIFVDFLPIGCQPLLLVLRSNNSRIRRSHRLRNHNIDQLSRRNPISIWHKTSL